MIETAKILLQLVVMPGLIFTAAVGLLSSWIDRKVTARVQWRSGPPWYQPFADIVKLLGKETIVPENGSTAVFLSMPLIGLSAVTLVSTMLWIFNLSRQQSFIGDLIVVIYLLTVPSIALIIGGSSSRNPLSALGASREMKMVLAYEFPFLLAVFTVIAKCGSLLIGNIVEYQAAHGMMAGSLSGTLALAVSVLVMQAKLSYVPFDASEAEQELMGGPLLEYSGTPLALFKLTRAMLLFVLPVLLITLFLGGISLSSPAGIIWFSIKYVLLLTAVILIKNTNPRLRIDQAVRFFWGPVTCLALAGLALALMGL